MRLCCLNIVHLLFAGSIIASYFQPKLPSDKREARTQSQQKTGDMTNQPALHFALMCVVAQAEKIKQLLNIQRLLSQRRFIRRQSCFKVGYGTALSQLKPVLDVQRERRARPAMQHGLRGIPLAFGRLIELGEQRHNVELRHLVSGLLTK